MAAILAQNNYGKSQVRLVKVTRHDDRHDMMEVCVDTSLEGDFDDTHFTGDNAKVLPTDTQKNTVYALARQHTFDSIEAFGLIMGRHFVSSFPKLVTEARINLTESLWRRVTTSKGPHPTTFECPGNEVRLAEVIVDYEGASVAGGISDLLLMKTTDSEFWGYLVDKYTTLKETKDRICATSVTAHWVYNSDEADFQKSYAAIRKAFVDTFAHHHSLSVQQTLYAMGSAALEAAPDIAEVRLSLPNRHCLLANLEPFGLDNPNVLFIPTDEPHGNISAGVCREHSATHNH